MKSQVFGHGELVGDDLHHGVDQGFGKATPRVEEAHQIKEIEVAELFQGAGEDGTISSSLRRDEGRDEKMALIIVTQDGRNFTQIQLARKDGPKPLERGVFPLDTVV